MEHNIQNITIEWTGSRLKKGLDSRNHSNILEQSISNVSKIMHCEWLSINAISFLSIPMPKVYLNIETILFTEK